MEKAPGDEGRLAADEPPLDGLSIDEITVEAIYLTSVGGVARVRARGRDVLLRDGDRLADGEVDGIDFVTPTVAWLRFRRRITATPGIPYRPVVWLLAARGQGLRPRGVAMPAGKSTEARPPELGPGLAIGDSESSELEVHRLGDERLGNHGLPPWTWEVTVEKAPRLFIELLGPDLLDVLPDEPEVRYRGDWIGLRAGFGRVNVRFTSHQSVLRAVAAELGALPSALRPPPPAPPAPLPSSSTPSDPLAIDEILWSEMDEILGSEIDVILVDSYDPAERRDPFVDLSAWPVSKPERAGWSPWGVSGLLIDEIEVEGLFMTPGGAVAEVRSLREGFFLREGDQLYDGDVERIDLQEGVTFKQIVNDPTTLWPFRLVAKRADPRWIGAAGASRKVASEPAVSFSSPCSAAASRFSGTAAILARDEAVLSGCSSWEYRPAGRRDPFRSLKPGDVPAVSPPSILAKLTCDDLTYVTGDDLAGILERAGQRLERYLWERGLVADHLDGGDSWARRFLDDVAETASSDLARLVGELALLDSLRTGLAPPPAETFALLGDLNLIGGRLPAAVELYGIAEGISPGQETLCGHLYGGKLYGAETFLHPAWSDGTRWYWLTGYLLAWDLASGRVVERHLLPALPEALRVEQGELQITLHRAGSVRLAGKRLAAPVQVFADPWGRAAATMSGRRLASNFAGVKEAGSSSPFEVTWWDFDDRLPLDLPELEKALREAAFRDPTQPWHPFVLGQALWAEGRRKEAETLWNGIWERGSWIAPYYELLSMAMLYEGFGQREWSDRAFDRALKERRRLSRPILSSHLFERHATGAYWLDAGLHDPERRYLWWRRLREITGIAPGDAFRAALWADDLERRGDRSHARDELAYLERARRYPFDVTTRSAWLDYSLYGVVACAAMLFAQLAVLGRRMVQRLKRRRLRWPGWRQAARALLHGLTPLGLSAALYVALSLSVLAASHVGYLRSLPFEPGDVPSAENGQTTYEDRFRLTAPDLLRAWLTTGVVKPKTGAPGARALLIRKVQEIRSHGAGVQVLLALAAIVVMFVIAFPAGLLLAWGRARAVVTRWVPGAAQIRAGARLKGYLIFGLFVFALVPLSWLVVARACGAVPAPGLVSANFFLRAGLEWPLLPLAEGEPTRQSNFEHLRARSFLRLLSVYPGAGPFWSLVACALFISFRSVVRGRIRRVVPKKAPMFWLDRL